LIVSLVVGPRTADTVVQVFTDFYDRTDGHLPALITTDEYAVYETVILDTYGVWWRREMGLTPEEIADFERVGMPELYFPEEMAMPLKVGSFTLSPCVDSGFELLKREDGWGHTHVSLVASWGCAYAF
jgi:hypothetical protein